MIEQFLLAKDPGKRKSPKAHRWDGEDTLCRMFSTGGLGLQDNWRVLKRPNELPICAMCEAALAKTAPELDAPPRDPSEGRRLNFAAPEFGAYRDAWFGKLRAKGFQF